MSFAVTAAPRSGTMALARMLNRSPTWRVCHQSDTDNIAKAYQRHDFLDRFRQPRYGEVSCALAMPFHVIPAEKKAVVLRCPRECLLSAWNYYHAVPNADFALCRELDLTFRILDWIAERYHRVSYRALFTPEGLRSLAEFLGVDDLPEDVVTTERFHEKPKQAAAWDELPRTVRERGERLTDWFKLKWSV